MPDGTGDLGPPAVIDGEGERHARMVARLGKTALKDVAGLLGERGDVTEKLDAHVLTFEQRQFIDERLGEKVHEQIDLSLRAIPILRGKGVSGQNVNAHTNASGDDVLQRHDTGLMALSPTETTGGRPSAVAVHDAGDMARNTRHIDICDRDVIGMLGEELVELFDVIVHD